MLEWKNLPNIPYHDNRPYKHAWSFYYWLKKNGENPEVEVNEDGSINITIRALV